MTPEQTPAPQESRKPRLIPLRPFPGCTPKLASVEYALHDVQLHWESETMRELDLHQQAIILAYEVDRLRAVAYGAGLDPYADEDNEGDL